MRAEPVPVRQLAGRHISNSFSRLVVGPNDHRFLVYRHRKSRASRSTYFVHSITAWEPGWVVVKSLKEVKKLIEVYSHKRI